jgi:hypothetical protein
MHKIHLDIDENIKQDFDSKFKTTTDQVTDKPEVTTETSTTTTKNPITTEIPRSKTSTTNIPFDDSTTTTEAVQSTTAKPAVIPPPKESHYTKWVLGETLITSDLFTYFSFQQNVFKNYSKLNS